MARSGALASARRGQPSCSLPATAGSRQNAALPARIATSSTFRSRPAPHTRYGRLAAFDVRDYYTDWDGRDARMLCYTSEPLSADHELSGHPCVTLHLCASEADAALHVYLEDVAPDGTCRYVTEGMLRALHRKECAAPDHHKVVGPYHSYSRADAAPLVPGEVATLRFSLLPTSWRVAAGHRLRVAIAGADADNFGQVPHGRPPILAIQRGGAHASSIVLPLRPCHRTE